MGRFAEYKDIKGQREESLRINKSKGKITGHLRILKYRDQDTRQMIAYIPSLQISGYGATLEKAIKMMQFSIDDLFQHFINLPITQLEYELSRLGWKRNKLKKKEFSQAYIDIEGNLKNFNAVNNEVEEELISI